MKETGATFPGGAASMIKAEEVGADDELPHDSNGLKAEEGCAGEKSCHMIATS